ncbi:uncharacterized protein [Coffea arabica]|uniref:Retrovirus-related Pol polyprotein from transposon RE1 n=1 Tax=Coffea arabica TaxID=13443 RepID=A0ABM4UQV7_COFAR
MSETSSDSTINPQTTASSSKNRIESLKTGVDSHSIQITTIRLNGDNFLRWSQAVRMYIRGRGKMGYLTGETKAPICTDPAYATWDAENSMVMTWLVNSMEEDISSNYMCYSTAQELWENINQMYSDLGNQSRIFELTLKIGDLRQGEDTVTKYFNSLKRIWQDLDLFNSYEWKSTEDFQHHKKTVEDSRIFKFLAGLNVEFDEVRGRIIGRQPLPSIGEVFSEVRREESRRNVMLGKKGPGIAVEGSALEVASSFKTSTYPRRTGEKFSEKSQVWCDYCNKPRHTRDTCWKLHGKPPNWKNKGGEKSGRGVPTANEADAGPFTKEQMEHLLMLLKSSSTSSDFPNASMAHTGIGSKALFNSFLSNSSTFPSPWIIDSGASDHMTNSFKLFQSYTPCSGNKKIKVADGGFSPVAGKGSIQISKNVNLKSVLHVPKLASSLLSVSKLTKDSNCLAIFDESHCAFQDKNSRMTIGRARMINGLYCLEDNSPSAQIAQEYSSNISVSAYEQIMGENSSESNFWETEALPTIIFETDKETKIPQFDSAETDIGLSDMEILRREKNRSNLEPVVYTRRNIFKKGEGPLMSPAPVHEKSSREVCPNTSGNTSPFFSSAVPESDPVLNLPTQESDLDLPIAIRKGTRTCTRHPISKYVSYDNLSPKYRAFTTEISKLVIPRNIKEALVDQNWKSAVFEEMEALRKNDTWDVVELPREKKIVGCKWVFTVKSKADGTVERYKARLVAKGFTQTHGIDYQETFAPVAKINSIRVLLSLAINANWPLYQLDVKNAFLNGDLEEEVFMSLPPGFVDKYGVGKVCKLKKSLYGLKQSPRAWFERFSKVVKKFGFLQSQADHTLFYRHSKEGKVAILIVYVDDIILTGDDCGGLENLKKFLAKEFEIKDLGNLKYFLGMEFARSKEGIVVSQKKYVLDLLKETGMMGCRPAETPMEPNLKLQPASVEKVRDREKFQRLVGRLIYLSHTRPDIAFPVSIVSQFMHSPGSEHFEAIHRILRYLKGTPGKGIFFKARGHLQVEAYTDADWAGCITDRRSTSGYCTYVGGNLVTWRSKKQNVVARSSAEAEFRAVAQGICEVIWIRRILQELKVSEVLPMKLYCDNKAAISIAHNPVLHDRTKHVEVDKHFIKEKIEGGVVCMTYVPTRDQVADLLTKSLPKKQFDLLVSKLVMKDIFKPA